MRQFGVVALVGNERVGVKHGSDPLASGASLAAKFGEMFKVAVDVTYASSVFQFSQLLPKRLACSCCPRRSLNRLESFMYVLSCGPVALIWSPGTL